VTGASSGPGAQTAALDVTDPAAVDREKAMTDSVGALAQCEAALEVFRRQQRGHLELVGSTSALRGMRRSMTVYAATEAGVASLAEGRRSERTRGMVDTGTGVRAVVAAIEARRTTAYVPARPWVPIGVAVAVLPLPVVWRLS
jgi:NADP-dependent 3-hydroxy acid dehydrogenase YdfG